MRVENDNPSELQPTVKELRSELKKHQRGSWMYTESIWGIK